MTEPTIIWPPSLSAALEHQGIDLRALASELGLSKIALQKPGLSLPLRVFTQALDKVVEQANNPGLGLAIGADLRPELFGVVAQIAMTSATYGEALSMVARYKRLVAPERLEVQVRDDGALLRFIPENPGSPRARMQVDAELAWMICFGRRMTKASIVARAVYLSGPKVSHATRYEELFGCAPTFMAKTDAVLVDAKVLELPMRSANLELHQVLCAYAEDKLSSMPDEALSAQVESLLKRLLPHGEPTLEIVAQNLNMSVRSLQRHLQEERTSFRGLLDATRATLAQQYLAREDLAPNDIAFLLGFGHVQSFYRAFRRWTGSTPELSRRSALDA